MLNNRFLLVILSVSLGLCIVGCTKHGKMSYEKLSKEVDSLEKENVRKDRDIKDMMSFVGILADGLDSIAKQEEVLFYSNKGKEGTIVDRNQLKKNLEMFEKTLANQKQRIAQLIDSLKARGESVSRLTSLVTYLNQQLEEKNEIIKSLQADLENKNVNISQLQQRVHKLTESNTKLNDKVEKQVKALNIQTEILNEGYVKIGTKKTLAELGLISTGLFKKTKINYNEIDKDKFMRIDIRNFTEITINSSNPKILTQMPASSYKIEKGKGTSTLYILDPTLFWSVSNYLIIQTK